MDSALFFPNNDSEQKVDTGGQTQLKVLMGIEYSTIDEKGRILVSKKKRERLGEDFVVGLGPSGCLVAYTAAAFSELLDSVKKAGPTSIAKDDYVRDIIGTADDDLKFDAQGRVVIPAKLREMGKLKKSVVIIGAIDKIEIWAQEEYERWLVERFDYNSQRAGYIKKAQVEMLTGGLQS